MNEQYIEDSYPLSPLQQGMLFHDLYAPHSGMYHLQLACAFHEKLNVTAFKQAWQRVIARHPVLRTSFHWEGFNEPLQRVHKHVNPRWVEEDCRAMPLREQNHRLETYLQNDKQQGFKLTEAPLMRLALFQMGDAEYRFIWTSHHAIKDGRSRFILLNEVFSFYEAFCSGKDIRLKHPRPYRDYIDWLAKENFNKSEDFWRRMLKGVNSNTPFVDSISHSTSDKTWERYEKQETRLSANLTRALQSVAKQHGLTPNTILQGAWALLLSRYSGEQFVVFGATRACRRSGIKGAESMVGLFINTLPVTISVAPNTQLLPWLKEIRSKWIAMRDHEQTPIIEIQKWSDIPAGTPLFDSILTFENFDLTSAMQAKGGKWINREFRIITSFTNFPIAVVGYLGSELLIEIAYNRRRFKEIAIARMLGHIETLLESIVADPEQRLSDVRMLMEPERKQMLVDWNDTSIWHPRDRCVHQLFEQQVEQTPGAVAVVYGDEQLTYRELNTRANQLARYLNKLGVGPEVLVGICLERSLEMVVGMLGTLKAGGAYVPLDPGYPRERLGFMLDDTGSPVLLTHSRLVEELPRHEAKVICIDSDWDAIARHSGETPVNATTVENLAYVIYTSGSTGKPKGVAISHGGLLNLVFWHRNVFEVTASDRATQLAGTAFDASVWEVWPYLTAGARLHVVSAEKLVSPEQLRDWMVSEQITLTFLPTPLAEQVLMLDWPQQTPLRTLLTGGDKLHRSPPESIPFKVVNNYGPTENTVVTTSGVVLPNSDADIQPHIGCPITNTEVYVLDERLRPVPVGIPGELCIGGESLARGYLNRPNLTAENFIPNPYSDTPGTRLYKSGDLVRYLPDGSIEFLGRIDHQVKIRGFRIELGEVESVLGRHSAVEKAVVIAREDVPGDKRLVAYVVASHEPTPTFSELRSFMKEKLPDYMIPTAFVFLDLLPLTPNGKVDRRALPAPEQSRSELEAVYVAPQSEVERIIADTWQEALRIEKVGLHDNFFDLGGHSLLLIQIHNNFQGLFKKEITIADMFRYPTIKALADYLNQEENGELSKQQPSDSIENLTAGKKRMIKLFKRRQQTKEER